MRRREYRRPVLQVPVCFTSAWKQGTRLAPGFLLHCPYCAVRIALSDHRVAHPPVFCSRAHLFQQRFQYWPDIVQKMRLARFVGVHAVGLE